MAVIRLRPLILACCGITAGLLLLFGTLELFPELININEIEYYALRNEYLPDPALVFVYRKTGYTLKTSFHGDLYSPSYGVDVPLIPYVASYNEYGFRHNSSQSPFEVAVIGDSFIEFGESDLSTFSEKLKEAAGLTAFNLGRAWYGPYQYVEILKRYGLALKPKYVLLCFFAGNDIEDIKEYKRWRHEGQYYFYSDLGQKNVLTRFALAAHSTISFFSQVVEDNFPQAWRESRIHPDLSVIRLGSESIYVSFFYWNSPVTVNQLLVSEEWQVLKTLLRKFKDLCLQNGILPIVVFIPTKIQVYGEYYTLSSGRNFLKKISRQRVFETNSIEALISITRDIDLPLINLLPHFKRLASEGALLYYPFDTHWNVSGRTAAADFVAASLRRFQEK